jgi:hypothetical protein
MKLLKSINITLLTVFIVLLNIESTWAQPQEVTFNFTGGQQSFVVPDNVVRIHIQALGAQGADTFGDVGGLGGFAVGDLAVNPGQTLRIFVGGQGTAVTQAFGGGGFNGGGDANSTSLPRGGGGGASDVRVGGVSLNDRVIVAGGGGGATDGTSGGDGGGITGGDGSGLNQGFGGTQDSGGAGAGRCLGGVFGLGGDSPINSICAGGGGGWYGGGAGSGGGGGSSFIDDVENGSTTSGVRDGDGLIALMFTPLPSTPIPTLSEWV